MKRSKSPVLPLLITRRGIITAAAVIGFAMALALGGVAWIAVSVNDIQQKQIESNANRLNDLERIQRLETPTSRQITARIRRQFETCKADPVCLSTFVEVIPAGPRGRTGATGARGSRGPRGVTGAVGPGGPRGSRGLRGAEGARGVPGPVGPEGPQGPVGTLGDLPQRVSNLEQRLNGLGCELRRLIARPC